MLCFARRLRAGFACWRSGEGNAAGGAADRERVGASAYDTVRPRQRQSGGRCAGPRINQCAPVPQLHGGVNRPTA